MVLLDSCLLAQPTVLFVMKAGDVAAEQRVCAPEEACPASLLPDNLGIVALSKYVPSVE